MTPAPLRDSRPHSEAAATKQAPRRSARLLWIAAGVVLTGVGVVGVILPVMPGTVFLILAAACFARGSPRLEALLLNHPKLGPSVIAWRRDGAIPVKAKAMAFAGMALSIALVSVSGAPPIAVWATIAFVAAGALYVGTRPSRPKTLED
ncbi:YbaN family protein [Chenggangzhangella methanolivorans]|uniref:YbaN family protein n=1 Tax=Chenggangzhangella methanolivorans TaxID=1437009 RepID=A0A9E6R809_9HYPH|nr:YbaN family protein [Chenggangzhangella methanolivorans]QZN99728.1 YbaN family protein [Chenggangzhangella methanolivorans]